MRLLRATSDGDFHLSEHDEGNIPPFAILSHTWGADNEEVLFDDVVKGVSKKKPGYIKLQFCATQSRKDDLEFFWIDTCCINKQSSAELSEAINCMFQWYSAAAVCYVYLSDVTLPSRESTFPASRWFSRGWTLQELIAPNKVLFFDTNGESLGSKSSLCPQLEQITGIPLTVLQGTDIAEFSVGERMRWAEGRTTRRAEDAVYCLLGLLSINIPLIYGEGRKRAFARLRRELRSLLVDPTVYGPSLYNAVRKAELVSIDALLQDGVSVNYVHSTQDNETILHAAVRSGSIEVLDQILEAKPMLDPYSRQGVTPLMLAAALGNISAVTKLLDAGCVQEFRLQPLRQQPDPLFDVECPHAGVTEGSLPLLLAAQNGHHEIVELLLQRGSDIEAKTSLGFTALVGAAVNGHLKCVKMLLDKGANTEVTAREDFTALLYSASNGHVDVARALLDAGADIKAKKTGGMDVLLEAAWHEQPAFLKFIIERGIDPAIQTEWGGYYGGMTALHLAVDNDDVISIDTLIQGGVPLDVKNDDGETAMELAKRLGRDLAFEKLARAAMDSGN